MKTPTNYVFIHCDYFACGRGQGDVAAAFGAKRRQGKVVPLKGRKIPMFSRH